VRRILVLLAGCGRLGFAQLTGAPDAPASDAPTGDAGDAPASHDEDSDGVADDLDNCPCIANASQDDGDGDSVGDACDPHPAASGDKRALFVSFASDATPFTMQQGALAVHDDALYTSDTEMYSELRAPLAIGAGQIEVVGDVATMSTTTQRQIAVGLFDDAGAPHNYAELWDDTTMRYLAISEFDGTSFFSVGSTPLPTGFQIGAFALTLSVAPGAWQVDGGWAGNEKSASSSVMYFSVPTSTLDLGLIGFTGDIRAVCAVTSP
jgi:hypothetical protein